MRTITSHYVFKQSISITQCRPPQLPENFSPYITRTFTRMKYSYSSLNAHLYPYNLVPSATCSCRTGVEDCFHFFYNCPFYDVQSERMIYDLTNLGVFDLRIDSLSSVKGIMIRKLHLESSASCWDSSCQREGSDSRPHGRPAWYPYRQYSS
jgi:hypothetical protein